ncbi:MAG TPA: TonB-dependent receptor [Candidatus Kapabacteria bacterium]|nr:TonB-dependent receptor [Candidatus Kapabacteria bacterium]
MPQEETKTVSGFVSDSSDGETLIGAAVSVKGLPDGQKAGAITNKQGYYVIQNIPPGKYTLHCTYLGYRTQEIEADVRNSNAKINVIMPPEAIQANDVTIEANKDEEKKEIKISTVDMSAAQLQQMPSIGEADVFRALQYLPGILTASQISSGLYIRGGSPDQNLILMDGSTLYNPSHLFGFFSTFNPDAVKDVELIKGGFPAEYGGRLSAVINVTNKDGDRNKIDGDASLGLVTSRLTLDGPLGNGSFFVSGRRTYADLITSLLPNDPANPIPNYYFYDLNGKLTQNFGQNDKVFVSGYGGSDNLALSSGTVDFGLNWGNKAGAMRWTHLFSDKVFSDLNITASNYFSGLNGNNSGSMFALNNQITDYTAKGNVDYYASENHLVKAGFEFTRYIFNYYQNYNGSADSASQSQNDSSDITAADYALALYAQDAWQVTPLLSLQAGLRTNWTMQSRIVTWDPRVSLRYIMSDFLTLKASWGIYHQYLHLAARPDFSFFDVWLPTDSTVPPEQSIQYILGAETHPWEGYDFNVEMYYKPLTNIAEFRPYVFQATKVAQLFSIGTGQAYGVEFFFQKKIGPVTGWVGYTLSWITEQFADLNYGQPFPATFDRRHDIDVIANWQINDRWRVGAAWTFASGQPYTAATSRYAIGLPSDKYDSYTYPGDMNSLRLPDSHRLDASASYQTTIFNLASTLNFDIYNVYSYRDIWFRYYDTSKNPTVVTDVRLLPIIPTFSIEVKF